MAGVLGNLFGGKKKDEDDFLSYDKTLGAGGVPGPAGFGSPGLASGGLGLPGAAPTLPSMGGAMGAANQMVQKDMELITSKLDSLRVSMDTILQRLSNIEAKLAQQAQQPAQPQQPSLGQTFGFGTQQQTQQPAQQPPQQQDSGWHF